MRKMPVIVSLIPVYIVVFATLFSLVFVATNSISVLAEEKEINDRHCVIIDPGHGGVDGGATSCNGVLESEINLQIALRLNDLMHFMGMDTVMIRDTDRSVYTQGNTIAQKKVSDLKERVRIANSQDNALLISIHQNHFSDSRYYGPQVFYGKVGESQNLAITMQNKLSAVLCPESNRKAKAAFGVYLMDHIQCEGVLVECGFLSNFEEDAKLRNADYQKKLCGVIATACAAHLDNAEIT